MWGSPRQPRSRSGRSLRAAVPSSRPRRIAANSCGRHAGPGPPKPRGCRGEGLGDSHGNRHLTPACLGGMGLRLGNSPRAAGLAPRRGHRLPPAWAAQNQQGWNRAMGEREDSGLPGCWQGAGRFPWIPACWPRAGGLLAALLGGQVAQEGRPSLGLQLVPCSSITTGRVPGSLPSSASPRGPQQPHGCPRADPHRCPPSVPGHTAPSLPRPSAPGEPLSARSPLATSAQAEHGAAQPPAYLLPYVQLSRDGTNAENMALRRSRHGRGLGAPCPPPAPPPPRGCHHRQGLRGTRGTLWDLQMSSRGCHSRTA